MLSFALNTRQKNAPPTSEKHYNDEKRGGSAQREVTDFYLRRVEILSKLNKEMTK